ncbi:hypothetical protein GCK72_012822 [Caenorhabditis remanei]|uniref:Uncharacterized protein n=1 Tax=Caenorhabditis remanei TaxID=31234 RepID=A0A6A5GPH7_CAERE|nr:hypothetical protein GCK72_012822 [Caenorhabditis remanei]KAF1756369.1 hypothetical protein GCK72_012822 [Caenorhabditis remanei]
MDNMIHVDDEDTWKSVMPVYGPAAGVTFLVAAGSFLYFGYKMYKKHKARQAAIAESKRQNEENRENHEAMRQEREQSQPRDMPIEMQTF